MNRWLSFFICAILGLLMLLCGLLVPAHLRAVDASVLEQAGKSTPGLIEAGRGLLNDSKLGPAQLVSSAAQQERIAGWERLDYAVDDLARQHPGWATWGCPEPRFESIFLSRPESTNSDSEPFTEYVIRLENRDRVLELLRASGVPAVGELLRFRAVTNTVLFPPSQSSAGQALDAALCLGGLLLESGQMNNSFSNSLFVGAISANRGNSQAFEQSLMDLLSLGQRFNWGQLVAFVGRIPDLETLRLQAGLVRKTGEQLPVLFAAVQLSGQPEAVAKYVMAYSHTGLKDLGSALEYGAGGLTELLRRNQRVYAPPWWQQGPIFSWLSELSWRAQGLALAWKWLLYLSAGFLLAAALHFVLRPASALERPLRVRGFHMAREVLFALGFLVVALLLSEPFLAEESQRLELPFQLRLPTLGSVVRAETTRIHPSIMNKLSLLTLLLFFVLQGLLYTACLVKLAEIRRQKVSPRLKLRLLDNEDHLFDAGLYLGFVGTIISLILVSLGIIKPSLMAAYSSTSFGIIFVSIFKIFHVRPLRRKLVLEAEAGSPEPYSPAGRPSLVTSA